MIYGLDILGSVLVILGGWFWLQGRRDGLTLLVAGSIIWVVVCTVAEMWGGVLLNLIVLGSSLYAYFAKSNGYNNGMVKMIKPKNGSFVLTKNNVLIPLGLVISMVVGAVYATFQFQNYLDNKLAPRFLALQTQIEGQTNTIKNLQEEIKDLQRSVDGQWSITDMKLWVLEFKSKNPTMDIPIPSSER